MPSDLGVGPPSAASRGSPPAVRRKSRVAPCRPPSLRPVLAACRPRRPSILLLLSATGSFSAVCHPHDSSSPPAVAWGGLLRRLSLTAGPYLCRCAVVFLHRWTLAHPHHSCSAPPAPPPIAGISIA
ncbi:hypothetical protein GUJ93_ZPchr0009g2038 [Zizania palustris]|uniref:Uncharacterized protein n=1 Tax=Zizania palustris TaxID=103762 RepID=A0A8J5VL70_ZIZPA|nr:hypothetical protein GUJ93_ZPchr0009g2038 [Zizania palustris]